MRERVKAWFNAKFLNYDYWRVTYPDGKTSKLVCYTEAKALTSILGGKMWIDYENVKP